MTFGYSFDLISPLLYIYAYECCIYCVMLCCLHIIILEFSLNARWNNWKLQFTGFTFSNIKILTKYLLYVKYIKINKKYKIENHLVILNYEFYWNCLEYNLYSQKHTGKLYTKYLIVIIYVSLKNNGKIV